jgi:glycosyltransferase involved in cell wall biosynthesis
MRHRVDILSKHNQWILGGLIKESINALELPVFVNELPSLRREYFNPKKFWSFVSPPQADSVLVVHHEAISRMRISNLKDSNKRMRILLTHFEPETKIPSFLIEESINWERILVQNSRMKERLLKVNKNIDEDSIIPYYGAIDRKKYFPAKNFQNRNYILIVGDCKPRKNPKLVKEVIRANPHLNFVIHGKGWEDYGFVNISNNYRNLIYITFNIEENPRLMRNAQLLLSLSQIEGGPFPVLEALASGTPVVATDTGFCRELINQENGVLVNAEVGAEQVSLAINEVLHRGLADQPRDFLQGKFTWIDLAKKLFE